MAKFIELTHCNCGDKFSLSVDKIIFIEPRRGGTYVAYKIPRFRKGFVGFWVVESYEQVKCMIKGASFGVVDD